MTNDDVFDLMAEIGDELEQLAELYGPHSQPFLWLVDFQHMLMAKQGLYPAVNDCDEDYK